MVRVGQDRGLWGEEEGDGVRSGPGEARTILRLHVISVRPAKQPLMVRTFLKVCMELIISMHDIELVLYFFYCGRNSMRNLAGIQLYLHLLIFELSRTSEGSSGGRKKGVV